MTPKFILSCESTLDLPYSYVSGRGLPVLFYNYTVDGVQYVDDMGRDENALPNFYSMLQQGKLPTTTQLNPQQYFDYLEKISAAFMPPYFRREMGDVNPDVAESIAEIPAITAEFQNIILKNLDAGLDENQTRSWEYLDYHRQLCDLLAACFQKLAEGKKDEAERLFKRTCRWLQENETAFSDVFDVFQLQKTLGRAFKAPGVIF